MSTDKLQAERVRIYEEYEKTYEADVVNFVPGEICVVTSVSPGLNESDMYRLVQKTLNGRIAAALQRRSRRGDAAASDERGADRWVAPEDLSCPLLAKRYHLAGATVNHETVLTLKRAGRGVKPAIALARANGTATFLGFYQLDADITVRSDPKDVAGRWRTRRLYLVDLVYEAVRLINLSPIVRSGVPGKDLTILAVTPNWLTVGAHNGGGNGCGSPGGVPKAIATGHAPKPLSRLFKFSDPTLRAYDVQAQAIARKQAEGAETPPSGVVVAVLDTSPTAEDIKRALGSAHVDDADKWLLRTVHHA